MKKLIKQSTSVFIVGILNATPDSFSDGNRYFDTAAALEYGKRMFDDGADIVDIGGDSTRPGSACVGVEEEWNRIGALITGLSKIGRISVDTHHGEVARRAIDAGASIINDVSGGSDESLLEIVASSSTRLVLMHSATRTPHKFPDQFHAVDSIVDKVKKSFDTFIQMTSRKFISPERLILDPGMGAFISKHDEDSFEILRHLDDFAGFGRSMLLGCSRKGFLRSSHERSTEDRDVASVLCAIGAIRSISGKVPLYLRVHNVTQHRRSIDQWTKAGV